MSNEETDVIDRIRLKLTGLVETNIELIAQLSACLSALERIREKHDIHTAVEFSARELLAELAKEQP